MSSSKQFQCGVCKIVFPSHQVLNTHIEIFHPNPIRPFSTTVPSLGASAPTSLRSLARNPTSNLNPVQGRNHFDVDFYRRSLETQGWFHKRPRRASEISPITPTQWGTQNSRCGDICPQSAPPAPRYKFLLPKVPELMNLFPKKPSEDKRTLPLISQLEMRRPENTVMEDVGDNMSSIDLELKL